MSFVKETRDGKMIITHPSGHVDTYDRADVEAVRDIINQKIAGLTQQRNDLSSDITEIINSGG